jgi:hypothetical protein
MKVGLVWAQAVTAVEGDFLVYAMGRMVKHNAARGLLRELLAAAESPEGIVRFCRRWGVLPLCEHGIPARHGCAIQPWRTEIIDGIEIAYGRQAIAWAQTFATALESVLRIGVEMSAGRPGRSDDWDTANRIISGPDFGTWQEHPSKLGIEVARLHLQILLRRLIEICDIRPRFFWNKATQSWQIDLDSDLNANNIPALLVIELIVTIADKDGFAICSSCHKAYIPTRRPDPSRRNYCQKCGTSAAQRDAAREYRKRKKVEN